MIEMSMCEKNGADDAAALRKRLIKLVSVIPRIKNYSLRYLCTEIIKIGRKHSDLIAADFYSLH